MIQQLSEHERLEAETRASALFLRTSHIVPALYAVLLLVTAIVSRYAVLSNDTFGLQFQASHLSLTDPASFYNAFFPVGYPLFLCLVGLTSSSVYSTALVIQCALGGIFAWLVFDVSRTMLPPTVAIVASLATILLPGILRAELSLVPDFFTMFAVLVAIRYLLRSRPLSAGLWLGVSLLFRTHAAVFAASVVLVLLLFGWKERRAVLRVVLGIIPFAILLLLINSWAASALPDTSRINGSAFNLYKAMYGVSWSAIPAHFNGTLASVITANPSQFEAMYMSQLVATWYVWIPLVLLLLLRRRLGLSATWARLAGAALVYQLITLAGDSARGPLPIAAIVVIAVAALIAWAVPILLDAMPYRRMVLSAITGFAMFGAGLIVLAATGAGDRIGDYGKLAAALDLRSHSEAAYVYTDDFALYFPTLANANPRYSGGWPEIGLPLYARTHPALPTTSGAVFWDALKRDSIRYAVFRTPPIAPAVLVMVKSDTLGFQQLGRIAGYSVFRVK